MRLRRRFRTEPTAGWWLVELSGLPPISLTRSLLFPAEIQDGWSVLATEPEAREFLARHDLLGTRFARRREALAAIETAWAIEARTRQASAASGKVKPG